MVGVSALVEPSHRRLVGHAHDRGVAFGIHGPEPHGLLVVGTRLEHDDGDTVAAEATHLLLQAVAEVPAAPVGLG